MSRSRKLVRWFSAEPQSQARQMVLRSSPVMRRRESATAVPYSGAGPSTGTVSPHRSVPEVKLVPDTSSTAMSGGATCVRATELTDDELEAMLYRLHRVRRRRASEAAAASASRQSSSIYDTSAVRLLRQQSVTNQEIMIRGTYSLFSLPIYFLPIPLPLHQWSSYSVTSFPSDFIKETRFY